MLQAKFKRMQQEELQASGIDYELSEKDALIEELSEQEDSFSIKEKSQMIKKRLKKSETKPWNAWPQKKNQINPLEAAPKRSEDAGRG